MQPASTIGNHARLLHCDGNLCDAGSSHTHHLREKFLRQRQINAPDHASAGANGTSVSVRRARRYRLLFAAPEPAWNNSN